MIRVGHDHVDRAGGIRFNQLFQMSTGRRNAGFRLQFTDDLHSRPQDKVVEESVVLDDRLASQWLGLLVPFGGLDLPARQECVEVLLVHATATAVSAPKRIGDGARHRGHVVPVEDEVRVSFWVNVALRAAHLVGLLDEIDELGEIDEPFGSRHDLRVVGLPDERRHKPDLQRGAIDDEKVRLAQLADERGARHHEMRIFITLGEGGHAGLVLCDLPHQRRDVGIRDHDLGLGVGGNGECEADRGCDQKTCHHGFHGNFSD